MTSTEMYNYIYDCIFGYLSVGLSFENIDKERRVASITMPQCVDVALANDNKPTDGEEFAMVVAQQIVDDLSKITGNKWKVAMEYKEENLWCISEDGVDNVFNMMPLFETQLQRIFKIDE